ncbi:phage major capsid protein [Pararhizobium gei]|uniref:phage major capsid protein n=1 Tax=Pararhizobium gei TaxID=1395951 RepID=UPI0023DBBC7A|nr:phage major capsid protein [Rhizobium gei]
MNMHIAERGRKAAERVDAHAEIKSLTEALATRDAEIKQFATKAGEELKNLGQVSSETKAALDALSQKGTDTAARLAEVEQRLATRGAIGAATGQKSAGQLMIESEQYKSFASRSDAGKITLSTKATITSATTGTGGAGDLIVPDRRPEILAPAVRSLTIRQLLLPGSTSSNAVEYVKETGFTNGAAPVAEGAAVAASDLTFDVVTTNVKAIGHMVTASRQILNDAPMLASYIDTRANFGLKLVEENQILAGDGTGQNLNGILNQATAYTGAQVGTGVTKVDVIRKAILQCRLAELVPNFVALNPTDWAEIELLKDANGQYLWVNLQTGGTMILWRLNVIETSAVTAGEFLVGAGTGAQVFDREQASIEISTEHSDYFAKNLVAIKNYERLALAVYRPEAFIYGEFAA